MIKVLLIEDDEGDYLLIQEYLSAQVKVSFDLKRADRLARGLDLLGEGLFDIVLLDLGLPDSSGTKTFDRFHEAFPSIPVIILTGLDDEETAVQKLQAGAQDYLVKGQIGSQVLIKAIRYAIERNKLLQELEMSLKEVKTLSGLLPICASCKKIRDDKGYWNQIESYISKHSEAKFTHGICPECTKKLYPELIKDLKK